MASDEANAKLRSSRPNDPNKPYSRRRSIVGRVTAAMKDMISPSWLVDLVTTIKKKTPPPHAQANQHQMEASHVQHRYVSSNEMHHDPIVRAGLPHSQPVFTQSMAQHNPMGATSMASHPLLQVPTTAAGQPVSGPVQFTSESLPFHQQKGVPRTPNIVVNGTDDQSELSDYSVSTSGCSSMIPHPDRKEYQREVLEMNESRIHQLRQELGGSVTPSKEIEAKSRADPSSNISRGGEKSFLWSSEVKPKRNTPQPSAKRHKPSFNASLFGATQINTDGDIHKDYQQSPFYPGKTAFGGAASHRKGRLKAKAPYQMAPTRKQVTARPLNSASGSAVTSSTAKRILDALDQMSSPLNDVKKIPSYNANYANSPLSFTPSSYRRRAAANLNRTTEGPPTQSLVTPSRVAIVPNLQRPGSGANLIPKSKEPATLSDIMKVSQPQSSEGVHPSSGGHGGKMRRERGQHYSNKPADDEKVVEVPDLPTKFRLPVSSMFKIDFSKSPVPVPRQANDRLTPGSPAFRFSSPLAGPAHDAKASSPVSLESFQFSSPITVNKSGSTQQVPSPEVFKSPAPSPTGSHKPTTDLAFKFNPATAKRKQMPSPASADVPQNFKAALQGSSGGTPEANLSSSSPKPASELKQGSVMDILGKMNASNGTTTATSSASRSLAALFQKAPGAWECPTCMCQNKPDAVKCPSCETDKPKSASATTSAASTTLTNLQSQPTLPVSGSSSLSRLFQKPEGSWECPTCMVQNKTEHSKCPACQTPKPSAAKSTAPTTQHITILSGTNSLASLFTKQAGSWECPTCMVQNKAEHKKCPACETANPRASSQTVKPVVPQQDIPKSTGPSLAALFKKPSGTWDCDTCMVTNNSEASKCIACEMPKPGMKATTSFTSPGGFNVRPTEGFHGTTSTSKSEEDSQVKPPSSGFPFGSKPSSSSSAAGTFVTAQTVSKQSEVAPPGGGFKFGAAAINDTMDNNNKAGFGGFKFGQSKGSGSDIAVVAKSATEAVSTGLGETKSGQASSNDTDKADMAGSGKLGGFKFGQSLADTTSSNKTEASVAGGFKFGQTISSDSNKPPSDNSGTGGFKFGTSIASASKDNDSSSKTNAIKEQTVATPAFSFGVSSTKTESSVKAIVPEKSKAEAPAPVFGAPASTPVFGVATKALEPANTKLSTSGFGTFGSLGNDISSSNATNLKPFVFGSKTSQQKSGSTGVALGTANKQESQTAPSGLFTFGQAAKTTPSSSGTGAGTLQFGTQKASENTSVFGAALGTNKASAVGSSVASSTSANLFSFNAKPVENKTTAPVFGQKRSEPDDSDQGPTKRVKEASFPKSQSTPAFGSAASVGPFGSAAFNATGSNQAPGFGTPGFSGVAPPAATISSNPTFQFGSNGSQHPAGLFQFGGAPKSEAPAANPGFAFGQTVKPATQTQPAPNAGFNFNSNATPNFNFGAGNAAQAAPAFGAVNPAPQAPGGPFKFGATATDNNPFSAAPVPGKSRQIKKAVRKLRK